jgi:anti-anti-sigma regulatory factor
VTEFPAWTMTPESRIPTLVEVLGALDGSRRDGLLMLADRLVQWGIDDVLVSLDMAESVDSAGAEAVLTMLEFLRGAGVAAHLVVSRPAIGCLRAASKAGPGAPLACLVNRWMSVPR